MAQDRNFRVFRNKLEMLQFFGSYVEGLDVKTSARLAPFMYVYQGKILVERNFIKFLRAMEGLAGLDIDESVSAMRGGSYIVFFNKEIPNPARRGASVTAKVKSTDLQKDTTSEENTEKNTEVVSVENEEVSGTDLPEQNVEEGLAPVSDSEQDLEKIITAAAALESESDKKGSKDKLADFASSKGVTLNKTKTFENMLADFKTALGQ